MVVKVVRLFGLDAVKIEVPLLEAAHYCPGLRSAAMLVEQDALDLGPWCFLMVELDDQVLVLVEVCTSPADHSEWAYHYSHGRGHGYCNLQIVVGKMVPLSRGPL